MSGRQPRTRRQSSPAREKAIERKYEEKKRDRQHQKETQREQVRLQQAFNEQGQLKKGWMEDILNTDDLEEYLNEYEIQKIRGLVNRQWVLANLSDAQVHDRWYKLEVMKYKIYGAFPPEESLVQGPLRAFLWDDETENLTALSQDERNAIDQIITSLQNMVTRSADGFERKQINTSIARSESETDEEDDSGGGLGLFS